MKVRAKVMGYYGHKRRKVGEVFELVEQKGVTKDPATDRLGDEFVIPAEKQFSKTWMEKVDEDTPVGEPEITGDAHEPVALSKAGKKEKKKSTGDAEVI